MIESDSELGVDAIHIQCFVDDILKGEVYSSDYDIEGNDSYYLHYGHKCDEYHGHSLDLLYEKLQTADKYGI